MKVDYVSCAIFSGQDELEERLQALREDRPTVDECMQRYRKSQFVLHHRLVSINTPETDVQPKKLAPSNQNQDSSADSSCVVALSFAKEDTKAALAMKELLIAGYPNMTISEPRTNATSRLKALDAAEVIIILLSPEYLNSKELVEELNIALYRHRITPHQVVYPIHVAPLPTKPAYVHLLPSDFSALDFHWKLKIFWNQMRAERISQLADGNDIEVGEATCLLDASELILKRLTDPGYYEEHTNVIVNNLVILKTWNDIRAQLSKENGLNQLKMLFGVELTGQGDIVRTENNVSSVSESKRTESHPKIPVEQDEKEQQNSLQVRTNGDGNSGNDNERTLDKIQTNEAASLPSQELNESQHTSEKSQPKTKACLML